MNKELTLWNNLRMILTLIPFEGVKDGPFPRGTQRLGYQYHNFTVLTPRKVKVNEQKAKSL